MKRGNKGKANAISFCMGFGGCVGCKSYKIFKILLMLMEYRILLMGNTVEMEGGDIYDKQCRDPLPTY